MVNLKKEDIHHFKKPIGFYNSLFNDITNAEKSIHIETFKLSKNVAVRLKKYLMLKLEQGVKVKLLIDHWGSMVKDDFFSDLEEKGAEVRFFRVFKFAINAFAYNNRRDHRKIIVIDDEISYVGSSNLTNHNLFWREFVVRINNSVLACKLKEVFLLNFGIHSFFFHSEKKHLKPIRFENFEIVRDVPSLRYQKVRNKFLYLINKAKKEIIIETPYFVPDVKTVMALLRSAKKGVNIKLIVPEKSDIKIVDLIAQGFYGKLHKAGVKVLLAKKFSHAKLALFDDEIFYFGSSNFDYRSFRYQYDIGFFGEEPFLKECVKNHLSVSLKNYVYFDFKKWRKRSLIKRLKEIFFKPIRYLF